MGGAVAESRIPVLADRSGPRCRSVVQLSNRSPARRTGDPACRVLLGRQFSTRARRRGLSRPGRWPRRRSCLCGKYDRRDRRCARIQPSDHSRAGHSGRAALDDRPVRDGRCRDAGLDVTCRRAARGHKTNRRDCRRNRTGHDRGHKRGARTGRPHRVRPPDCDLQGRHVPLRRGGAQLIDRGVRGGRRRSQLSRERQGRSVHRSARHAASASARPHVRADASAPALGAHRWLRSGRHCRIVRAASERGAHRDLRDRTAHSANGCAVLQQGELRRRP